jgi:hypothetical protein
MEDGTPVAGSVLESKRIGGQNETTSWIYPGDDLSGAVYSGVMEGTQPERERRKIRRTESRDYLPDGSSGGPDLITKRTIEGSIGRTRPIPQE